VATVLGDFMQAELTVVGGLVPPLLVPQGSLMAGMDAHCGTLDLDLGLSLAVLDAERYAEIAERLRAAGFCPDRGTQGQVIRQRWRTPRGLPQVTIDFLIPPSLPDDQAGRLRHLEDDFAAIIIPALDVVAEDWRLVCIEGRTLWDEPARRQVRVCGPGAFTVLKARAFRLRGSPKDAYDLFYVLHYCEGGFREVADALAPLLSNTQVQEALAWLAEDFATIDSLGPKRVALFRYGGTDDDPQADVHGVVQRLLDCCGAGRETTR
jgi:hypothetical protein